MSTIIHREVTYETPWFQVESKTLEGEKDPYFALQLNDYVGVMAILPNADLVCVRQYRPVVEAETLEFVAGQVEPGETPQEAAARELLEEAGYLADSWQPLGPMMPDAGRLGNRHWGFLARDLRRNPDFQPEPGVTPTSLDPEAFQLAVTNGAFQAALHLGLVASACARGLWKWPH